MNTDSPRRTRTKLSLAGDGCWRLVEGSIPVPERRAPQYYTPTELPMPLYENVGSFTKSFAGTDSTGSPALRQAVSPPTITNVLNPFSRSKCATRALVASRAQVQYK